MENRINDEVFSEVKWTKKDIECLLKENDLDYSESAINDFLANLDVRRFEEQCVRFGWELLRWSLQ